MFPVVAAALGSACVPATGELISPLTSNGPGVVTEPRSQEPLQRTRDSDPSEMTDFEQKATTEELQTDRPEPAPAPNSHRTPGSAEGERNRNDQSR